LLKRVFAVDALSCHRCRGRREVLSLITQGSVARDNAADLEHLQDLYQIAGDISCATPVASRRIRSWSWASIRQSTTRRAIHWTCRGVSNPPGQVHLLERSGLSVTRGQLGRGPVKQRPPRSGMTARSAG